MTEAKTTRLFSMAERRASGEAIFRCIEAWRTNQDDPDDEALLQAMGQLGLDVYDNEHLFKFFLHAGEAPGAPPAFEALRKFATQVGLGFEFTGNPVVVWK